MKAMLAEGKSVNSEIEKLSNYIFQLARLSIVRGAEAYVSKNRIPDHGIEKQAFDFFKKHSKVNKSSVNNMIGISRWCSCPLSASIPKEYQSITSKVPSTETIFKWAIKNKIHRKYKLKFTKQTLGDMNWDVRNSKYNISPKYLKNLLDHLQFHPIWPWSPDKESDTSPTPKKAKELRLQIDSLKAVKRYGWEVTDWGDDNIYCGGNGVDSISANQIEVPAFGVHTFDHDGEYFDLRPDRTFVKFNLNNGPWPRIYLANIFISEKDSSGFIEFLIKFWDEIKDETIELAGLLIAAAIGGAGAGAIAGSGIEPLIGTIIGAALGATVAALLAWLAYSSMDDIFNTPDNPILIELESANDPFGNNKTKSSKRICEFRLGSASYIMKYYWEVVF